MIDLRLGDCLELMREIPNASVDCVITDPPYNVGLNYGDTTNDERVDYPAWIMERFNEMRRIARAVILTPGIGNLFLYPKPKWVCGWFKPGSTRRNGTGGFNEWEPVLVYAEKMKFMSDAKRLPDCVNHDKGNTHPCPKPLNLFTWLVETSKAETILDPFMGSGTTGVACVKLNRSFVGFEINPDYFAIAKRRIEDAQKQPVLELVNA